MTSLHVVYRVEGEGTPHELWTTYSFPEGIYASGDTLQRARLAFHQAGELHFADDFAALDITEHIERPVVDDIYVRVAVDQFMLDRQDAAHTLQGTLTIVEGAAHNRADFAAAMVPTMAGELVMVACVARDPIRWVLEQTSADDAIGVCTAGPSGPGSGTFLAWIPLVRENAVTEDRPPDAPELESLADGGLEIDSTVGELLAAGISQEGGRPSPVLVGRSAA